ncbi:MAG: FAD-binding oxidoreductase [Gemmatimonas sp.]
MPSEKILPNDPRYTSVVNKAFNKRFRAAPDYVCQVTSAAEIVAAVNDAVQENRRVVVTSGGHCLEGFVSDPEVRVIIDVSAMKHIYHDVERQAIAVEAGATVGETFRALHENWGTVIPLGEYPGIGMGGHVAGGAFGFLCRQLGLTADYLYGVELVTVNKDGHASITTATREKDDPNRELWWAFTGAGGGNFGIATRYWFRSHDAVGNDPTSLLPPSPTTVATFKVEWNWSDVNRATFQRLLTNHGSWSEHNSDPDSPNTSLWTLLEIHRQQFGKIIIRGVSTASTSVEIQIDEYVLAMSEGIVAPTKPIVEHMSWLEFALNPLPELFGMPPDGVCTKIKDAMLKARLTEKQIDVAYDYLCSTDYNVMGGGLGFATYGGRVNAVASDATASPHRRSIFDVACSVGWLDQHDATANLKWVRAFYRDLFADAGGAPVPGDRYDGCLINHPDVDLADATINTSGTPWHTIYFQENYPRLQRVKTQWDPCDIFRHALSIRAE